MAAGQAERPRRVRSGIAAGSQKIQRFDERPHLTGRSTGKSTGKRSDECRPPWKPRSTRRSASPSSPHPDGHDGWSVARGRAGPYCNRLWFERGDDHHHHQGGLPTRTASAVTVKTAHSATLGTILVDQSGLTLYRYTPDGTGKTTCTGACAAAWPPLTLPSGATHAVPGAGVTASALGTITRPGGALQVTFQGMPLYRFAGDKKVGQTSGQGVAGTWFVVSPTTTPTPAAPAASASNSPSTTTTAPMAAPVTRSGGVTAATSPPATRRRPPRRRPPHRRPPRLPPPHRRPPRHRRPNPRSPPPLPAAAMATEGPATASEGYRGLMSRARHR